MENAIQINSHSFTWGVKNEEEKDEPKKKKKRCCKKDKSSKDSKVDILDEDVSD